MGFLFHNGEAGPQAARSRWLRLMRTLCAKSRAAVSRAMTSTHPLVPAHAPRALRLGCNSLTWARHMLSCSRSGRRPRPRGTRVEIQEPLHILVPPRGGLQLALLRQPLAQREGQALQVQARHGRGFRLLFAFQAPLPESAYVHIVCKVSACTVSYLQ